MYSRILLGGVLTMGLSGCFQSLLSEPVSVMTPQGLVVCELYTDDSKYLDKPIAMPPGMSYVSGKRICAEEGSRIMRAQRGLPPVPLSVVPTARQ